MVRNVGRRSEALEYVHDVEGERRVDLLAGEERAFAERISDDVVLRDLPEHGASRKIRHVAREKTQGRWIGF